VEDEIGHAMADMQPPGFGLANSSSPATNVNVGSGNVQNNEGLEWLQLFDNSTVGVGGGLLNFGYGLDCDKMVHFPNGHDAESDGAIFYDKTTSFQDMMESFEFPEFFNSLAYDTPAAASEAPRTSASVEEVDELQHLDSSTPQLQISTLHNLDSAYPLQASQSAPSSTDDQEYSQASSPSSSTTNEHNPPILRPFACDVQGCTRSYKRVHELRRHKKAHSGLKPYVCGYLRCVRSGRNGFARKDHLLQHLRQVHGQRR